MNLNPEESKKLSELFAEKAEVETAIADKEKKLLEDIQKLRDRFEKQNQKNFDRINEIESETTNLLGALGGITSDKSGRTKTKKGERTGDNKGKIVSIIRDAGSKGIKAKQIEEKAGLGYQTVNKWCNEAKDEGLIRNEKWFYFWNG